MQCGGGCQNRPFHVVSRPESTAKWTQNAKHQGLAMAMDELQDKKPFGDHWSLFAEERGHVKGGKHRASLAKQISLKLQELIKKSMKHFGEFYSLVLE